MIGREHKDKGGSMVELVLVLPVLVLVLCGIIDLWRAFHDYIVISNASREGARYASRYPNNETGIKTTARDEAVSTGVPISSSLITVAGLNAASGNPITVTVRYPFQTILARIVGVRTITLTAQTQMLVFGYD